MKHGSVLINSVFHTGIILFIFLGFSRCISNRTEKQEPIERVVAELNVGETQNVQLHNGKTVKLTLLEIGDSRDSIRGAIRSANARISVDGEEVTISSGNYNLPVVIGKVQIDCPVIKTYHSNTSRQLWALGKDARFRLWPEGSPLITPGTFMYPVRQKWFATKTQAGNAPVFENDPENKNVYYHEGFDIGGTEGITEVVSATAGMVVSAHGEVLKGHEELDSLRKIGRPDVVYVMDNRGWYYRYSHFDSVDSLIKAGSAIKMGQRIGFVGKQGGSGGWVHLHFDIINYDNPQGKLGIEDAYAYAMEAYVNQYKPSLIAVARPHSFVWTEQEAILNGSKSKSFDGEIVSYEWFFSDGTTAQGAVQRKKYEKPGEFSEILKVTNSHGNVSYDFACVQVIDREKPGRIPYMHASYCPTFGIKPGGQVTFSVRTFFKGSVLECAGGEELWNFGDSTPPVRVKSLFDPENENGGKYAETVHCFSNPGDYLVKVERLNECGFVVFNHLYVKVEE